MPTSTPAHHEPTHRLRSWTWRVAMWVGLAVLFATPTRSADAAPRKTHAAKQSAAKSAASKPTSAKKRSGSKSTPKPAPAEEPPAADPPPAAEPEPPPAKPAPSRPVAQEGDSEDPPARKR